MFNPKRFENLSQKVNLAIAYSTPIRMLVFGGAVAYFTYDSLENQNYTSLRDALSTAFCWAGIEYCLWP